MKAFKEGQKAGKKFVKKQNFKKKFPTFFIVICMVMAFSTLVTWLGAIAVSSNGGKLPWE